MLPVELISSTHQKQTGSTRSTKKSNTVKQMTRVETGSLTHLITVVAYKLI